MFTKASAFDRADYASVHDSLLTLYHGVKLHHRGTSSCQWTDSDYILPTLRKVSVTLPSDVTLDLSPPRYEHTGRPNSSTLSSIYSQ